MLMRIKAAHWSGLVWNTLSLAIGPSKSSTTILLLDSGDVTGVEQDNERTSTPVMVIAT